MEYTVSIGMMLLSPRCLLSAMLVSQFSNRVVASQSIRSVEDAVSVLAFKDQLVSFTHYTNNMM